ncbi:hypothetical protein EM20IM_01005 [Candidatus Methylacidiphilum infernorum]|uniref:HAD superfamily hydrolase n=1 Tax=Candidatus Methylacidiphilum infernorum TaxID=511746 RepID=A0ABX7PW80_9BACT|nr:hypothetical protein [Candidatus Methylacidiphilum infernorum]QSR86983.1 hypothetical protein EM20IM_01005 [Candidatus Methylacidiphilum infernorum]
MVAGFECTCCSESLIRSGHPLVKEVVLSGIFLDYDDTLIPFRVSRSKSLYATRSKIIRVNTSWLLKGILLLRKRGCFVLLDENLSLNS